MSIVVTGATGHLGRLTVEKLLDRGVEPGRIVAGARSVDAAAPLAARGVDVRRLDFDDPATLADAFAGAERVLIVSGRDFGVRVGQHVGAARAAQEAGATLVAYTSGPYADTSSMQLLADHRATEEGIRALGVPFTFLRNGWYLENYTDQFPTFLAHGIADATGDGRVSAAARADFAEAAAAVLTGEGHENAVYELGGDTSFSLAELADVLSAHVGVPVPRRQVTEEALRAILVGAGVPGPAAAVFADVDRAISEGALLIETGDLSRLIGHPATTLAEAVAGTPAPGARV